jgi:hypothetical protein
LCDENPVADVQTCVIDYLWKNAPGITLVQRVMKHVLYTFELDPKCLEVENTTEQLSDALTPKIQEKNMIVGETTFVNRSNEAQQFTVKAEQSSTSTCDITLTCGLKKWGKLELRIPLLLVRRSCYYIESNHKNF